ncbi:exported hypothetical protein [Candidatus Sulfotelmatomonas gaucii]|uniref:Uncharacterized protein n=1 Tax=Candidatus Sulfuritelmatomonas gaucii TaxID=2043161 RepID=A0A2N9LAJ7_9BACT|nr:exported hypothetical protein [Candidatus Sulfotelmatomonas gaucii]
MMRSAQWQFARIFLAALSIAAFAVPKNVIAQDSQHLVSPSDPQKATVDASQSRQQNIDTLNSFFSSDQAQKAFQSAHMNPQQVKKAVAGLSDQELAQLASRAQKAQNDFAAGNMSNYDLLIILICIAALILIIVAVR